VLYALVTAALKDVHEAHDVAVDVGVGVFDGVADAGLGGHVEDDIKEMVLEERVYPVAILNVQFGEGEVFVLFEDPKPGLFEFHVVVIVQVVDAHNGLAIFEEPLREVKADKTRRPRHKDLSHVNLAVL